MPLGLWRQSVICSLLIKDPSIVRNRLKVAAAVNNAKRFLEVQKEFGSFSKYIWPFVDGKPKVNRWTRLSQLPATSKESDALSADLKKRGFKFVGGPKDCPRYAPGRAAGMVYTDDDVERAAEDENFGKQEKTSDSL